MMQISTFQKLTTLTIIIDENAAKTRNLGDRYDITKDRLQLILQPSLVERYTATVEGAWEATMMNRVIVCAVAIG